MDDSRIIELFFERSEQAVGELSLKYGKLLLHIAFNILGDREDARECVNDAYLGIWKSIPPKRPERLSAYVCRVARNQALKRYRDRNAKKRRADAPLPLEELADTLHGETLEETWAARELGREINRFLGTIDRVSRTAFVRRYFLGDSVGDIARFLRLPENSVSVKLFRTRARLQRFLEEREQKGVSE